MPLFVCDNCDTIDNTALGHFWSRHDAEMFAPEYVGKALCSACAPRTYRSGEPSQNSGQWHGRFKQVKATAEYIAAHPGEIYYLGRFTPEETEGGAS